MISRFSFALLVAAAVALSACGKSEEPAEESMAPETGAVEEGKTMMEQAAETAKEGAGAVSEMSSAAMEKGAGMAEAMVAQAEELIQKVKDFIESNQLDLAEEAMTKLRGLKDSLPASLQEQIDNLETMLSSAAGKGQ
jgi:hypothetical protein